MENSALTGPGDVLHISSGTVSALALSTVDVSTAVVCFNVQGQLIECRTITLDTISSSTIKAGNRLSLQSTSATSYISVSASDAAYIIVCYDADDVATCSVLNRSGYNLQKAVGTVVTRAGSAQYLTVSNFEPVAVSRSSMLCYHDGATEKASCEVIKTVVQSGSSCSYSQAKYVCDSNTCNSGVWSGANSCERTCEVSNIAAAPMGGDQMADSTCTPQFGAHVTVSPEAIVGWTRAIAFDSTSAAVCYAESGFSKCLGLRKIGGSVLPGNITATLSAATTTNLAMRARQFSILRRREELSSKACRL